MYPTVVFFSLYFPESETALARRIVGVNGSAIRLSYAGFQNQLVYYDDIGEINPNYTGFKTMGQHCILTMEDQKRKPLGFCVFKIHKVDLVEIDIILIRKDLRSKGLGKKLYGHLEQSFNNGTAFYVENTTHSGNLFFKSCGFYRDVDLIKVVNQTNRVKEFYKKTTSQLWLAC